jgi:hypothetical protein
MFVTAEVELTLRLLIERNQTWIDQRLALLGYTLPTESVPAENPRRISVSGARTAKQRTSLQKFLLLISHRYMYIYTID